MHASNIKIKTKENKSELYKMLQDQIKVEKETQEERRSLERQKDRQIIEQDLENKR
jgi:hypothetical protein